MFKVYVMIGLPGSGKSTWVKNNLPDLPVISRDIIRNKLGYCKENEKFLGNKIQEAKVTEVEYKEIETLCSERKDFVIDDTNMSKYRKQLINLLQLWGAYIIFVTINTPVEICINRRNGQIEKNVFDKMIKNYYNINPNEYNELIEI